MGTKIHGIFTSENLDSSGEKIDISGLDISTMVKDGIANWEHNNNEPVQVVGKIKFVKKIMKRSDAINKHQEHFWDKVQMPYLYGIVELFDEVGHAGAKEVAAMVKYDNQNESEEENKLINFSIEGYKLEKEGIFVKQSIGRNITITIKPCNKVCSTEELIEDKKESPKFSIKNILGKNEANICEELNDCEQIEELRKDIPKFKGGLYESAFASKHPKESSITQSDEQHTAATPLFHEIHQAANENKKTGIPLIDATIADYKKQGRMASQAERHELKTQADAVKRKKADTSGEKRMAHPSDYGAHIESTVTKIKKPTFEQKSGLQKKLENFGYKQPMKKAEIPTKLPKIEQSPSKPAAAPKTNTESVTKLSSGKTLMANPKHESHKAFTPADHKEAANYHFDNYSGPASWKAMQHHTRMANVRSSTMPSEVSTAPKSDAPKAPSDKPAQVWKDKPAKGKSGLDKVYIKQKVANISAKQFKKNEELQELEKALEVGSGMGAPGTLTQGAALSKEDIVGTKQEADEEWDKAEEFDKFIKKQFPDMTGPERKKFAKLYKLYIDKKQENKIKKLLD
jgi:hypothetical protein